MTGGSVCGSPGSPRWRSCRPLDPVRSTLGGRDGRSWSNGPAPRFCPKNPSPTYQAGGRLVGCSPPGSYSRDLNHEINGQEAYIGMALGHSTRTPLSSWFHQNFPTERLGFRHAGINGSLIRPGIQKTIVSMVFTKQPLLVYLGF